MNILIVEDEKIQRQAFASIIKSSFTDIKVYEASTIEEAIFKVEEYEIDLFFIDINLNNKSGLELAVKIREYENHKLTGIVFVTGEVMHIVEAFKKIHCYDFIVKPYKENEIIQIINVFKSNLLRNSNREEKYTFLDIDTNIAIKLYHKDILYIEYVNKGCNIHTVNGVYTLKRASLSKILKLINDNDIIQTHKAFAVNINHIIKIEKSYEKIWEIQVKDKNEPVLLSYTYRQAIVGRLG